MKKDTKRPNGTIKRIQKCEAVRKGVSSMGTKFRKGDVIVHLSSSRFTGETFVLTQKDLDKVTQAKPGRWYSPKRWGENLHRAWLKTPWGQQWLVNMKWKTCQCKVCVPADSAQGSKVRH